MTLAYDRDRIYDQLMSLKFNGSTPPRVEHPWKLDTTFVSTGWHTCKAKLSASRLVYFLSYALLCLCRTIQSWNPVLVFVILEFGSFIDADAWCLPATIKYYRDKQQWSFTGYSVIVNAAIWTPIGSDFVNKKQDISVNPLVYHLILTVYKQVEHLYL